MLLPLIKKPQPKGDQKKNFTLAELYSAYNSIHQSMALSGTEGNFEEEVRIRYQNIGETLLQEWKLTPDDVKKLPVNSVLPKQTGQLTKEFIEWLEESSKQEGYE